jgi:hypothetical protein
MAEGQNATMSGPLEQRVFNELTDSGGRSEDSKRVCARELHGGYDEIEWGERGRVGRVHLVL